MRSDSKKPQICQAELQSISCGYRDVLIYKAKGIEILYSVGEENYFVPDQLEQPRQNKNLLYRHDKPNGPTKKGPLSFVLFSFNSQLRPQASPL